MPVLSQSTHASSQGQGLRAAQNSARDTHTHTPPPLHLAASRASQEGSWLGRDSGAPSGPTSCRTPGAPTSGGGQHVRESLPGRHHFRVLFQISKVLPDPDGTVILGRGERRLKRRPGCSGKGRRPLSWGCRKTRGCSGPHQAARGTDGSLIWGGATHRQCETSSDLTWGFRVEPPPQHSRFPPPPRASSAKKSWSLTGTGPLSSPRHMTQETGGTPLPASPAPGRGRRPSVLQQMGSQVGLSVGPPPVCWSVYPSFLPPGVAVPRTLFSSLTSPSWTTWP